MKKKDYSQEQIEMAALMKVLGHPARLAILEHLLQVKECICGEIEIGRAPCRERV